MSDNDADETIRRLLSPSTSLQTATAIVEAAHTREDRWHELDCDGAGRVADSEHYMACALLARARHADVVHELREPVLEPDGTEHFPIRPEADAR